MTLYISFFNPTERVHHELLQFLANHFYKHEENGEND